MKLSIVVPCYNVAPYLERGLFSLINQTLTDIEIICIDDASTDNTLFVLQQLARADLRIRVFENDKNMGVGYTRNRGMDLATGEFVGFMDPDDWVDSNFFQRLVRVAEKTQTPVVCGRLCVHTMDGKRRIQSCKTGRNSQYFKHHYTAIYLRDFLNRYNLHFPGLCVGEDAVFTASVKVHLPKPIRVVPSVKYHYCRRDDSLDTEIWNEKQLDDFIRALNQIIDMYNMSDGVSRSDYIISVHSYFNSLAGGNAFGKTVNMYDRVAVALCQAFAKLRYPDAVRMNNKSLFLALRANDVAGVAAVLKAQYIRTRTFFLFDVIPVAKVRASAVSRTVYLFGWKVWGSRLS